MRVQVNLSDEMVGKVDAYARKMGVSRSALECVTGQGDKPHVNTSVN